MEKSNIDAIKDTVHNFLKLDIDASGAFSPVIIQHPFYDSAFQMVEGNFVNILEGDYKEKADACLEKRFESLGAVNFIEMITKPYRLVFFMYIKDYLNTEDYNNMLRYAYTSTEFPNNDINVSRRDLLSMFKKTNKEWIMTEEENKRYLELPDIIKVYRGYSKKHGKINGLSWTLDRNIGMRFAKRFDEEKTMLAYGTIHKKDVLAYFEDEEEIIMDVKKMIEKPEIITVGEN